MRVLDCFSGIGGFALALEGAAETAAFCEKNANCRRVLDNLMARGLVTKAPVFEDITTLTPQQVRALRPDMITAGFPCQDISVFGTKLGLEGKRSSLVSHVLDLARTVPSIKTLFLENSPNFVHLGMTELFAELLRIPGMRITWGIWSARHGGALHKRRRWFCVATRAKLPEVKVAYAERPRKEIDVRLRLVPKGSAPHARMRHQMLGNSVVPQCVRLAFGLLSAEANRIGRGQVSQVSTPPIPKANPVVRVHGASALNATNTWSTAIFSHWTQNRVLKSDIQERALANQIFWDERTIALLRARGWTGSVGYIDREFDINPEWVELFMGYPRGWTRF